MFYRASSFIRLAIFNLSSGLNSFIPLEDWIDVSTEIVDDGAGGWSTNRTTLFALGTYRKYTWIIIDGRIQNITLKVSVTQTELS